MTNDSCGPYEPLQMPLSCADWPLRQGTKLGRTIYFATGDGNKQKDTFCGVVETPEIAAEICHALNIFYGHTEV